MKSVSVLLTVLLTIQNLFAQHEQHAFDSLANDTSIHNIKQIFSHGHFDGHARHYFMSTIHPGHLNDYFANAIGGSLGFNSARVHGFSLGLKGTFSYNVWSNKLHEVDENAGTYSAFEVQLFDVDNPLNRNDLDRLEEFYIDYLGEHVFIKFGKQDITSPLVNPEDGRMKPYVLSGLLTKFKLADDLILTGGFFNSFSPRSTTHWHHTGETIGIFDNGFAIDGSLGDYRDKLESEGMLMTGIQYHNEIFRAQLWNYHIDNISNTSFAQFNYTLPKSVGNFKTGLQLLKQFQVGEGGNSDSIQFQYHTENDKITIASAKLAYCSRHFNLSLNGLKSFGDGRFIFPREFGREQFFVTLPRGRVEGTGQMSVVMINSTIKPEFSEHMKIKLGTAYFDLPSVFDYEVNKYAIPSHLQFNVDLLYNFSHFLEGMEIRLLYIGKTALNAESHASDVLFNKSHYHQINLITNIYF